MALDLTDSVETLQAEIARLQEQLAKRSRATPLEFLGETIAPEILTELAVGRKLSPTGVKTRGLGMHGDGGNLWLQVTENGRSWVFRYRWMEKQREMGLGSLSEVTLAEARGRAVICRRLVRAGIDPIARRRALSAKAALEDARGVTFKDAAERYLKAHKPSWKNEKHGAQWESTLEAYVYPVIGRLSVQDVDTGLVLKVLEPIWTTKPDTASRVRGRIESVLSWATARGLRKGENPARWRGHIDKLLPAPAKVRAVKHHAALPWQDMHVFWSELGQRGGLSTEALRFAILTAARTGEVIGARWSEIDLKAKLWTVPAQRMKAGREHRVALSDEAILILGRMEKLADGADPYVFPGGKPDTGLSNMAMLSLLKKMGRADITTHGFRSAFKDWASEATAYPGDMVEFALAHTIGNKVEAAYRRGDMFEKRRRLMDDWARQCTAPAANGDNVLSIGGGRNG